MPPESRERAVQVGLHVEEAPDEAIKGYGWASERSAASLDAPFCPVPTAPVPGTTRAGLWQVEFGIEKLRDVLQNHREMRMMVTMGEWYKVTLVALMMRRQE